MEMIDALIASFYAIPAVDGVVQSNAILRLAVNKYGTPMFILISVLIILLLTLIIKRMKPKAGRPKPIVEKKEKPAKKQRKAKTPKPAKAQKVKGTPAAITKKLAKLPPSNLPLYPVADKRKPMAGAPEMTATPLAPPPSLDDASLVAGLDDHDAQHTTPAPSLSAPVKSFTLDEKTASSLMGQPVQPQLSAAEDDFDIPIEAPNEAPVEAQAEMPEMPTEPSFTAGFHDQDEDDHEAVNEADDDMVGAGLTSQGDDLDNIDLSDFDLPEAPALTAANDPSATTEITPIEPVPSLDFAAIEDLPPEPKPSTPDDDTELDIPVASFGEGGDAENLSSSAQQKLAELNDRGIT